MSPQKPPAEGLPKSSTQETIPKPPPKAPWLANCDAFKNPPPSHRRIHNNRIIPLYMLAWTCSREEFYANASDNRWQVDSYNEGEVVWRRLIAACGDEKDAFDLPFELEVEYGYSGEVYLGVLFNHSLDKYSDKVKDMWMKDPFLYLRDAFGISKNSALDETLAWYEYPVRRDRNFKTVRWQGM